MPVFNLTLRERQEIAHGTILLQFEKPPGFTFKPGQYGGFTLLHPVETDANGITRRFSLISAPSDDHIAIATRIQNSAYKRVLNAMNIGSEIKFAGPTGIFTLHEDTSIPAVFIAGGIGIAPFYSMIKDATLNKSSHPLILFYGNESPSTTAFLNELMTLQTQNPHFKFIPTMANADEKWQGEHGFITDKMIKKYVPNLDAPIYYVCGSPNMVTTLQETLAEMGINEDTIKIEDFPGY